MWAALALLARLAVGGDTAPAAAVETPTGTIVVAVHGLRSADGQVLFVLFGDPSAFPGDDSRAVRRAKMAISGSVSKVTWEGVPRGTYAIAVVHDENDNGEVDTNFLGIPHEGVGASNNARARFGPFKWKDAKFEHEGALSSQLIRIVYL